MSTPLILALFALVIFTVPVIIAAIAQRRKH